MGPAIDALELAMMERRLIHPSNPVLNWNMANAVATMDAAGNRKLDKENGALSHRWCISADHAARPALAGSRRQTHRYRGVDRMRLGGDELPWWLVVGVAVCLLVILIAAYHA